MADLYSDKFRDVTVKRGKERKIKRACEQCHNPELLETEIIVPAYPSDKRLAGFDFYCPRCFYKYKEAVDFTHPGIVIKRPGLYKKSSTPDVNYTQITVNNLILFFNTRLRTHPYAHDEEKAEFELLLQIATEEYEAIDKTFATQMLVASKEGNLDEDMFDHVWRKNWDNKASLKSIYWLKTRKQTIEQVIYGYLEVLNWWKTGTFSLTG